MVVNLPSEEVFTTHDYRRTEGVVRVTRPINLIGGGQVQELIVCFEKGRAVQVEAAHSAGRVRAQMAVDRGAARLGEVALVDGSSPIGQTGMVFGDILIDENATSHIAWGNAYAFTAPDLPDDEEAPGRARLQPLRRAPRRDDRRGGARHTRHRPRRRRDPRDHRRYLGAHLTRALVSASGRLDAPQRAETVSG